MVKRVKLVIGTCPGFPERGEVCDPCHGSLDGREIPISQNLTIVLREVPCHEKDVPGAFHFGQLHVYFSAKRNGKTLGGAISVDERLTAREANEEFFVVEWLASEQKPPLDAVLQKAIPALLRAIDPNLKRQHFPRGWGRNDPTVLLGLDD